MSWKRYMLTDKELKYNYEVLDRIPIEQFLINGMTASDIMSAIENEYDQTVENDPVLKGFIFNIMSEYDFMEYCRDRFNTIWYEKTEYIVHN